MTMDALSDLLQSLRLKGGIYFNCELSAPWGMDIEQTSVAEFHIVVHGRCWLKVASEESRICLEEGDVVVFPHGHAHILLDAPQSVAASVEAVIGSQKTENYGPILYGGGGMPTHILCGYFEFDRKNHSPLLDALPSFIHIKGGDVTDLYWLQSTVNFIHHETRALGHGTEAVVNRLVELLFIQIMRAYIKQSSMPLGVLSAIADAKVGLALNALHQKPAYSWTLEALSQQTGMSRTAFSQRFRSLVGQTPLHYLTVWRMQKAKKMLESGKLTLPAIAEEVGYLSEASFSKVFKKWIGVSPGACRRDATKA